MSGPLFFLVSWWTAPSLGLFFASTTSQGIVPRALSAAKARYTIGITPKISPASPHRTSTMVIKNIAIQLTPTIRCLAFCTLNILNLWFLTYTMRVIAIPICRISGPGTVPRGISAKSIVCRATEEAIWPDFSAVGAGNLAVGRCCEWWRTMRDLTG